MKRVSNISAEVLAAYIEGNATAQECRAILESLPYDAELREILQISELVDYSVLAAEQVPEVIPMAAVAAECGEQNLCSLECERLVLEQNNIAFNWESMISVAVKNRWLKSEGTALHNVGRLLESYGLVVTRRYNSTIDDIASALEGGDSVIVAVDGGELVGNMAAEKYEDILLAESADHVVVVLGYDADRKVVTIYDPNSPNDRDSYPLEQFMDAWNDSKNYLITITTETMKSYKPQPIDLSDVELTEDLTELQEAIAENAHDIWALDRQAQGWTYGPQRDDNKKQTPCMVPYSQLPDIEKEYDRKMAMQTIKLLKKLGYDLIRREDNELYRLLKQRLAHSAEEYHCQICQHPVYKYQVYCDHCGNKLEIDWSLHK